MKLEVLPSSSYTDDDQKNLKHLLDTFGSMVSLEDIASAYCEAGRDIHSAAEVLCNILGSTSGTYSSKSQDEEEKTSSASSVSSNILENAQTCNLKLRKCSASMGTVSDVIGKNYIASRPRSSGLNEKSKPVILNSDDFPVSEIWDEKTESASSSRVESMDSDIEEFLCKMLGNGFQLEKSVIQDVVGKCGYNMAMSIDKLLDLSAAALEKSDDVVGIAPGNITKSSHDLESVPSITQSTHVDFSRRSNTSINNRNKPQAEKKNKNMEREVLESLFSVPHIIEEKQESSRRTRPVHRSPYGRVVAKPLEETLIEDFTFITRQPVNDRGDEANQSLSYEDLRKGVMEYWVTMKEYYKAAVVAHTKKDYESAQRLLEEGNFYMRKAREADERSAQKLIENSDEQEEYSVNMHELEPKDALRHMKLQLKSLSGLPSIPCMKVVVGTDDGASEDGKRKRLITKLLEREGIPWTEEGNGWIISIRVGEIDPKKLNFVKK